VSDYSESSVQVPKKLRNYEAAAALHAWAEAEKAAVDLLVLAAKMLEAARERRA
jgi:hypothetical protein